MPPRGQGKSAESKAPTAVTKDAVAQSQSKKLVTPIPTPGPSNPAKAYGLYVNALNEELVKLVEQFEASRVVAGTVEPLSQEELDRLVDNLLERLPAWENAQGATKAALERALEGTIINLPNLVSVEWKDDAQHLLIYHDLLDISLTLTNRQLTELIFTLETIETLLASQTVQVAEPLFAYLETRKHSLTIGLKPGTGKALVILRMLNDLLRRLSKATHTVFCGRILLLLANIFPLGERSGVNLRGEYNKENVTTFELEEDAPEVEEESKDSKENEQDEDDDEFIEESLLNDKKAAKEDNVSPKKQEEAEDGEEVEDGMDVDQATRLVDGKLETPTQLADKNRKPSEPDFYTLFWSMQKYFSFPVALFYPTLLPDLPPSLPTFAQSFPAVPPVNKDGTLSTASVAAGSPNLTLLREGVLKMLQVFTAASKREKELQGAAKDGTKSTGKRSDAVAATPVKPVTENDVKRLFFYPKFLTSKALLDLEISDANFRKQVMVQCLILFQFLQSNTEAARLKLAASVKRLNNSALPPFRLSEADNKWVTELQSKVFTEIARTPTDGDQFLKTVKLVLQGERNWVQWKMNTCPQFDKNPVEESVSEAAQVAKKKLQQPVPSFPYKAGTQALTRLWQYEPKKSEDFVNADKLKNVQKYFEAVKRQNELIKFRQEELTEMGSTTPAEWAADPELQQLEERKASLAWRTLRIVSSTQLHLFSKIGVNDIEKLIEEMNKPQTSHPIAQAKQTVANIAANQLGSVETAIVKSEEEKPAEEAPADGQEQNRADTPLAIPETSFGQADEGTAETTVEVIAEVPPVTGEVVSETSADVAATSKRPLVDDGMEVDAVDESAGVKKQKVDE